MAATAAVLIDGGADYNLLHLAHFKLLDRLEAEMGDRINDLFSVYDAEPTSLLHMAVRDDFRTLSDGCSNAARTRTSWTPTA